MDRIRLKGLALFPKLGVTAWEKEGVQRVAADVDLLLDLKEAAEKDSISVAVDYEKVCALCASVAKGRKFHLVESLTRELAGAILDAFPRVSRVVVRVRKTSLPFDAHLDWVEVEMERSR